jgi:hypothetical protein
MEIVKRVKISVNGRSEEIEAVIDGMTKMYALQKWQGKI